MKTFFAVLFAVVLAACSAQERPTQTNPYGETGEWFQVTENHWRVPITITAPHGTVSKYYRIDVFAVDQTLIMRTHCGSPGQSQEMMMIFDLKHASGIEYACHEALSTNLGPEDLKYVDRLLTRTNRPPGEIRELVFSLDHFYNGTT